MEKAEKDLWKDNCVPNVDSGICERKWFCGGNDDAWLKAAIKRFKRSAKYRKRVETGGREEDEDAVVLSSSDSEGDDLLQNNDTDFDDTGLRHPTTPPVIQTHSSCTSSTFDEPPPRSETWRLKCRDGFKSMNPELMVCLGLLVSEFGVSENKAPACLKLVATLFRQTLKLPNAEIEEMEISEETEEPVVKKRKPFGDLTYTLPSPRTIHKWIEDQAILSLWHAADEIKSASDRGAVVTLHF